MLFLLGKLIFLFHKILLVFYYHSDLYVICRVTFIADERFQSFYVESTGIWTLQIKYVQARGK